MSDWPLAPSARLASAVSAISCSSVSMSLLNIVSAHRRGSLGTVVSATCAGEATPAPAAKPFIKEDPSVTDDTAMPGARMAAEIAEQPAVLGRLVARHAADRDQVRAVLPSALAGTVLLARGSSDKVAV